ncbi:hypothetical protein KA057_03705 [Candidatus Gracilibacteria bacterium]|nr:hypothetical protein [Candidatus Gracilibacteria bacterium]
MDYSTIINSIGLIADIIGAILLFKFGLPEDISRSGAFFIVTNQVDEEERNKAEKYDFWGKIGLILLIVGFIFQLISNFI